jgi:hypothetical protein
MLKGFKSTKLQLVERENKCSDCIYMELKSSQPERSYDRLWGVPFIASSLMSVFSSLASGNTSPGNKQFQLLLSIQFNEHWEQLPGGKIKFGLKRGVLRLHLKGCQMPLSSRELGTTIIPTIQTERSNQLGQEQQSALESSVDSSKDGNKFLFKGNRSSKATYGITDKFQFPNAQISMKGDAESPAWAFEVKTGEPILKGDLKNTSLGILNLPAHPGSISATFEASLMQDLHVTDAQGIWSKEISKKRRAMLARMLIKHFLVNKIGDYFSRAEFITVESTQSQSILGRRGSLS